MLACQKLIDLWQRMSSSQSSRKAIINNKKWEINVKQCVKVVSIDQRSSMSLASENWRSISLYAAFECSNAVNLLIVNEIG